MCKVFLELTMHPSKEIENLTQNYADQGICFCFLQVFPILLVIPCHRDSVNCCLLMVSIKSIKDILQLSECFKRHFLLKSP